jgi:calcium-dependent protein kinase
LDHPHIVKLHEVVKTATTYYLILDYCPHGSLSEHLAHKHQLPDSAAADIMPQLLSAYRHLLSQGILHRDIKPANILRVGKIWKLSDFGFAVRARAGFKDRVSVGTPLYLAPEALRRSLYSYKSDFYALGVVLF